MDSHPGDVFGGTPPYSGCLFACRFKQKLRNGADGEEKSIKEWIQFVMPLRRWW